MTNLYFKQQTHNLNEPKLAQAYIPIQQYKDLFSANDALYHGTIFRKLYQPYISPIH